MTKLEIKDYLENYRDRKTIVEYKKKRGEFDDRTVVCLTAIEECMESLPDGLGEILKEIYLYKVSLREMEKKYYLGRSTLGRRRDKAIEIMSACLSGV